MAITDNTFTPEEVTTAIETNPALVDALTQVLTGKEYVVRTKDAAAQEEAGLKTKHFAEYTGQVAPEVEAKIKELTGIEKESPSEKWTDYYQRAVKTVSTKAAKDAARVAELEGTSDISAAERAELKSLKTKLDDKETELTTTKTNYEQKILATEAKSTINSEVSTIKSAFKKEIPASAVNVMHNQVMDDMLSRLVVGKDKKMVFKKDDGTFYMNESKGTLMNATEFYTEAMKDFIDTGIKQKGAGGGDDTSVLGDGIPADIKNRVELSEYLGKKGLVNGSKEYNQLFNKYASKLPVR